MVVINVESGRLLSLRLEAVVLAFILLSLAILHPSHSYTIPRHGLERCDAANARTSNTARSTPWICQTKYPRKNQFPSTTRLKMSSQPPSEESKDSSTGDEKEPTFYEILNSTPDATRSELKKQYIMLARVSHPDAMIGADGTILEDEGVDFQKIAEAWRTLGNPKSRRRYDRDLKAREWGERAQRFTNEGLEQVAPVASKFIDNLAVPFLRRTSATAYAAGKAIQSGLEAASAVSSSAAAAPPQQDSVNTGKSGSEPAQKEEKNERTIDKSTTSANGATDDKIETNGATDTTNGFATDTLLSDSEESESGSEMDAATSDELSEQSLELAEQVKSHEAKAKNIYEELDTVQKQRMFATLQSTEYSISSTEAEEVLEKLTDKDTVSFTSRAAKKTNIEKEILSLRNTESQFSEKLEVYTEIDREWNEWLSRQEEANRVLTEKRKAEVEARKALDSAEASVVKAKVDVKSVSNKLRGVEQEVRRSAQEMDRVSTTLSRKQERVRNALRRKTELMRGGIQVEYITEEEVMKLRRKETQLIGESKQIATMVARLQSRADKLKKRAEALEQMRNP